MKRGGIIVLTATVSLLLGAPKDMTTGVWRQETKSLNAGTYVVERETLRINPDHTFRETFDVSLQKGEHFIKDLQIEAQGRWKRYLTTLVFVVDKIDVPFAKAVSDTIDRNSIVRLSEFYKQRFKQEPIRITTILFLDQKYLKFRTEKNRIWSYTKEAEATSKIVSIPKPVSVDEALRRHKTTP